MQIQTNPEAVDTPQHVTSSRRPLKSRELKFFKLLAAWLAKTQLTPNGISVASAFFGVAAGTTLALTSHLDFEAGTRLLWFLSIILIQCRLLANLLDGMVAIEGNKASPAGELFNEFPDRISDVAILLGAGLALGSNPTLGWLAAISALLVAYVRALGASAGAGQIFLGPMAKPHRMAVMTVACASCIFLPKHLQAQLLWEFGVFDIALLVVIAGCGITLVRRLLAISHVLLTRPTSVSSDSHS